MAFDSMRDLLEHQLRDIYSAERQILRAMPLVIAAAVNRRLAAALEQHRLETEKQVVRLEACFSHLGTSPRGVLCRGMEGLLEEMLADVMEEGRVEVRDAGIIADCQRVEQHELAMYGNARIFAHGLGEHQIVKLLDRTVMEEEAADAALADIAEQEVNPAALAPPPASVAEGPRLQITSSRSVPSGKHSALQESLI
jgi:ferritin-like metal-binding protein YciE